MLVYKQLTQGLLTAAVLPAMLVYKQTCLHKGYILLHLLIAAVLPAMLVYKQLT